MSPRNQSPRMVRIVGAILAIVWLGAGVAAIAIGVLEQHWLLVAVGLGAVWYGMVWASVARLRRLLTLREALMPWRIGQNPNV